MRFEPRALPQADSPNVGPDLAVCGVTAGYGRGSNALTECEIKVTTERVVAVVGPNGAGKSTLLRVIGGLLRCRSGSVWWGGKDISNWTPNRRAQAGIVHIPEGRAIFGSMTVESNLALGAEALGRRYSMGELESIYQIFPILFERRRQAAGTLSGGEQRMLAVGRGLMASPTILLLDEPTLGLSPRACAEVFAALTKLVESGIRILLVEQNLGYAEMLAERAILLSRGQVAWRGSARGLASVPAVRDAVLGPSGLQA